MMNSSEVLNSKLDTIDKRISEYRADYINYPSEAKKEKPFYFLKKWTKDLWDNIKLPN
jgi:hypothetical protein